MSGARLWPGMHRQVAGGDWKVFSGSSRRWTEFVEAATSVGTIDDVAFAVVDGKSHALRSGLMIVEPEVLVVFEERRGRGR